MQIRWWRPMHLARRKIVLLLLIALAPKWSDAQPFNYEWQWRNPLPQGNFLFAVYFVDEEYGWFVGEWGTIVHTADGGQSWQIQRSYSTARFLNVYFVDRQHGWIVGDGGILFRTEDGGMVWENTSFGDESFRGLSFISPEVGWISSMNGRIYRTDNGGGSWQVVLDRPDTGFPDLFFIDADHGWAVGRDGLIARTVDGGRTWDFKESGATILLRIHFVDANHGWIAAVDSGLVVTEDGGDDWRLERVELLRQVAGVFFSNDQEGWVWGMDQARKWVVLHTADAGQNWEVQLEDARPLDMSFGSPHDGWFVTGGARRVYKTTDGKVWDRADSGWQGDIEDITFINADTGWVAGSTLHRTNDGGKTWIEQTPGNTHTLWPLQVLNANEIWTRELASTSLFHSTDGGMSWQVVPVTDGKQVFSFFFVDPMHGWACGSGYVVRTQDGGKTWEPAGDFDLEPIVSLFFVDRSVGWAASYISIYKTVDGGLNWELQWRDPSTGIDKIYFRDWQVGWAIGGATLLHTVDGGQNWQRQPVPGNRVVAFQDIEFLDSTRGFVVASSEFWRTEDGGLTWQASFLPTYGLSAVEMIDPNQGWVGGAWGRMLYTNTGGFPTTVNSRRPVYKPRDFYLKQNYPNPFNSSTVVRYELQVASTVSVRVFNIQGELLREFNFGVQAPGEHFVLWDAKGLSSGVYLLQLRVGKEIQHRKALLIR